MHGLTKERERNKVADRLSAVFKRLKQSPRAVETNVDCKLNFAFEFTDGASVQSNDFSDCLADW